MGIPALDPSRRRRSSCARTAPARAGCRHQPPGRRRMSRTFNGPCRSSRSSCLARDGSSRNTCSKRSNPALDVVCAVGCQEDNCHYLEGSKRCARRLDHVRSILQEIGLGSERLMLFTLPGTAAEDMALGAGGRAPARASPPAAALIAAIRDRVAATMRRPSRALCASLRGRGGQHPSRKRFPAMTTAKTSFSRL